MRALGDSLDVLGVLLVHRLYVRLAIISARFILLLKLCELSFEGLQIELYGFIW